jgi:putative hydrolase of the HAD superfamily
LIYSHQWNHVLQGKISTLDHLEQVFAHDIFKGLNLTPKIYIDYWLHHDQCVNEDMIKLVQSLKIPAFIGTNQDYYRTKHITNLVGYFFRGCFSSYQMGFIKTEEGFFQTIENKLSLASESLLLIDDSLSHIEQAKLKGWKTFHYQGKFMDLQSFLGA